MRPAAAIFGTRISRAACRGDVRFSYFERHALARWWESIPVLEHVFGPVCSSELLWCKRHTARDDVVGQRAGICTLMSTHDSSCRSSPATRSNCTARCAFSNVHTCLSEVTIRHGKREFCGHLEGRDMYISEPQHQPVLHTLILCRLRQHRHELRHTKRPKLCG